MFPLIFFANCALEKYMRAKMFKAYVKVFKCGEGGGVINTLENYILNHFNNTQRMDFFIIQKKILPSKFYFFFGKF